MLTLHAIGQWPDGAVRVEWVNSARPIIPEVEADIDHAWAAATARPGIHLFDGPMCRLERWEVTPAQLSLRISPTTYKVFLGTNMTRPELADRFGPAILANPIGNCVALQSADGFLVLGRRNSSVAYYPDRVHPFAGALEPKDAGNPFNAVRRELAEELSFEPSDVARLTCLGLIEDHKLRQPELVFQATATRTLAEIRATVDAAEHRATYDVDATRPAVERALADPALTPVAVGSLLLWGRGAFGDEWFASARARL